MNLGLNVYCNTIKPRVQTTFQSGKALIYCIYLEFSELFFPQIKRAERSTRANEKIRGRVFTFDMFRYLVKNEDLTSRCADPAYQATQCNRKVLCF